MRYPKKSHKNAPLSLKPSFVSRPSQRAIEPTPPGSMSQYRSVVASMTLEMKNHSKRLNRHPTSPDPEAKHVKKNLKVAPFMVSPPPTIVSPAAELPTTTPSVPVPKDKGKALADPQVCRSRYFEI